MMKYIITLMCFVSSLYSQNVWEETFDFKGSPCDIDLLDSNRIFLTSSIGQPTFLYNSLDQGKSWKLVNDDFVDHLDYGMCKGVTVPSQNNIYIPFDKGNIYKSNDFGKSFNILRLDSLQYLGNLYMYNDSLGIIINAYLDQIKYYQLLVTKDAWKTFDRFHLNNEIKSASYLKSIFVSDKLIYSIFYLADGSKRFYFLKLNLEPYLLNFKLIDIIEGGFADLCVIDSNNIFACGRGITLYGGSCHDLIYKSTDAGKSWKCVLDIYSDRTKFNGFDMPEFGLQSIAFKDSLIGIAVGQFGKILYTYDGGESWTYESKLHDSINKNTPPTMMVKYAGSIPIIATYTGKIFRLLEDNIAPTSENKYSIKGRVWEGEKGLARIPIANGFQITMSDSNGFYHFRNLKKGNYTIKALNKYFDRENPDYYYKPFDYTPEKYEIELTSDTSGIDFNAIDLRTYHSISGKVVDNQGKGLIDIDVRFARSVITPNGLGLADTIIKTDQFGKFEFHNIESYKTWDITAYDSKIKFSPLKHTIRLYTGDTTDLVFIGTPITSVEENEEVKGSNMISPNPARDFITINLSSINPTLKRGVEGNKLIEIYDVMGVLIHSTPFNLTPALSKGEGVRIEVPNLNPGVYFVKIVGSNGACSIVEKFVKF